MPSYIQLRAKVYHITRDGSSYNIHAYIEYGQKKYKFFTLKTEKEIPKIIFEKYKKIKEEDKYYYPKVFIVPTPSIRTNKETYKEKNKETKKESIPFDDKFKLVVIYAKDPPSRIPLNKLIRYLT